MLKEVRIKDKILQVPIIQGGMGVGISLASLAGNVMKEGAMGVISAAHPGYKKEGFRKNSLKCNIEAMFEEVKKAREISGGKGLLGMNIMVASKDYSEYVKAAVKAKVDAIICGAGLPLELPKLATDKNILIAPIVSSGRAIRLILKRWDKRHKRVPDFVVIEGSKAGGHLGFKKEELLNGTCESLDKIFDDVKNELKPFEEAYDRNIPVFVAGGIFTGSDIAHFVKKGADGVQMATRFIATEECDAAKEFKDAVINCKKEDIAIVKSPTGFPGRGIMNKFMKRVEERGKNISISSCFDCLSLCNPSDTPYCISGALIEAVKGNIDNGLVFVGSNAYRVNEMTTVHDLINELVSEANEKLKEND